MARKHTSGSVARQQMEIAWAAPQVIARRVGRMMNAGASPDARDTAEFTRMFTEKASAFSMAWLAGWSALYWAPWQVGMELLRAAGTYRGGTDALAPWRRAWGRQAWGIAGSWLAPVHRTAVANAHRLRRR